MLYFKSSGPSLFVLQRLQQSDILMKENGCKMASPCLKKMLKFMLEHVKGRHLRTYFSSLQQQAPGQGAAGWQLLS